MSKKIQLTISEPCHENWDAMTDVEKGKFCGSCQKQVVDFTNMSDRQVAEFFKKPSTGSVCGRFMTDQLDRELEIPKKRIPWLKYFFTIAIPAFFASKASAQQRTMGKPVAKPGPKDTVNTLTTLPTMKLGEVGPSEITPVTKCDIIPVKDAKAQRTNDYDARNRTITGIVTDENDKAVPGASVIIKGTTKGCAANEKGEFKINAKSSDIMVISALGYVRKEITAGPANIISVKLQLITLDEVIVTGYQTITKGYVVMGGATRVTRKTLIHKTEKITVPEKSPAFKVYPNPVQHNQSINMEILDLQKGYYIWQLTSIAGQSIRQQQIWIDNTAKVLSLDVPVVTSGTYLLTLTNKETGKRASEKIIVQ